jgi:putative oxidoreductase
MKSQTGNELADYGSLLLRVSIGIMYLTHAQLKLFTFGMPGTEAFFESVGFPGWAAYPVVAAEVIGGVLLILGWRVRWVSLALIPILVGAATTHWGNGWVFTAKGGGWEYPVFLIAVSVVLALLGSGAYALDKGVRTGAARAPLVREHA